MNREAFRDYTLIAAGIVVVMFAPMIVVYGLWAFNKASQVEKLAYDKGQDFDKRLSRLDTIAEKIDGSERPQPQVGAARDMDGPQAASRKEERQPQAQAPSPTVRKKLVWQQADGSYKAEGFASPLGSRHPFVVWALGPRIAPYSHHVAKHMSGEHIEQLEFEKFRNYYRKRFGHTGRNAAGNDAETGRPVWLERDHATSEAVLK